VIGCPILRALGAASAVWHARRRKPTALTAQWRSQGLESSDDVGRRVQTERSKRRCRLRRTFLRWNCPAALL